MADLLLRGVALAAPARAGAGVCRLIVPVQAGDCMSTGNGESHSITNPNAEPLVLIGCVILD